MAKLEKKGISPIVAVIANWFVFGFLGYFLLGQTKKALYICIAIFVGIILCFVPGIIISVLGLIDVYKVAEAVEKGQEVDENEYKMELLYKVAKMIHKEAVFKGA